MSSDRGSQFTSSLWREIATRLGIQLHRTTAYHPQANGMIERFHRMLKAALMTRLTGPDWTEELPWVLLGLRTAPREDLGHSSAELVYGEPITIPGELIPPSCTAPWSPSDFLSGFQSNTALQARRPPSQHCSPTTFMTPSLRTAKHVYIRRDGVKGALQRPYTGPFPVIAPGDKTFLVDKGGRTERISIDRLKPAQTQDGSTHCPQPARQQPQPKRPAAQKTVPESGSQSDQSVDHSPTMSRTGRVIQRPKRYQ